MRVPRPTLTGTFRLILFAALSIATAALGYNLYNESLVNTRLKSELAEVKTKLTKSEARAADLSEQLEDARPVSYANYEVVKESPTNLRHVELARFQLMEEESWMRTASELEEKAKSQGWYTGNMFAPNKDYAKFLQIFLNDNDLKATDYKGIRIYVDSWGSTSYASASGNDIIVNCRAPFSEIKQSLELRRRQIARRDLLDAEARRMGWNLDKYSSDDIGDYLTLLRKLVSSKEVVDTNGVVIVLADQFKTTGGKIYIDGRAPLDKIIVYLKNGHAVKTD